MREIKMSKLYPLSLVGILIYNYRWNKKNSRINRMKCVTSERRITYTLHHLVVITKTTNNMKNRIPRYDAIKKQGTEQTFT